MTDLMSDGDFAISETVWLYNTPNVFTEVSLTTQTHGGRRL